MKDRQELQGESERDTLKVMSALGRIEADRGNRAAGEQLLRACLETSVAQFGDVSPDELIYQTATDLAALLEKAGRAAECDEIKALAKTHAPPTIESEIEHENKDARTDEFAPALTLASLAMAKMWADRAMRRASVTPPGGAAPAPAQNLYPEDHGSPHLVEA